MTVEAPTPKCRCDDLSRVRVVDFAADEEDGELAMPKLQRVVRADPDRWWLTCRRCPVCDRHWLVAQEERINDVYIVRELQPAEVTAIVESGRWPSDFDSYEALLRWGREAGHSARFVDTRCETLQRTARDLILQRPNIETQDISELLNVSMDDATWLRQASKNLS